MKECRICESEFVNIDCQSTNHAYFRYEDVEIFVCNDCFEYSEFLDLVQKILEKNNFEEEEISNALFHLRYCLRGGQYE